VTLTLSRVAGLPGVWQRSEADDTDACRGRAEDSSRFFFSEHQMEDGELEISISFFFLDGKYIELNMLGFFQPVFLLVWRVM